MARIIQTQTKVTNGCKIINYYKDKSNSTTTLYEGDLVNNLSYVKEEKTIVRSGRINKINIQFNSVTSKQSVTPQSFMDTDAVVTMIEVDHSVKNNSAVDIIPAREVLEYNADENKEIECVKVIPTIKVELKSSLSDKSSTTIIMEQGITLSGLEVQSNNGCITKIDGVVTSFIYKLPYSKGTAEIVGVMVTDIDTSKHNFYQVMFTDVKHCGVKLEAISADTDVMEALSAMYSDTSTNNILLMSSMTTSDTINLTQDTEIIGNNNYSASNGKRCSDETMNNETVFAGSIICEKDVAVSISGVTFTENARINPNGCKSLTFKNCRFTGMTPDAKHSYLILDRTRTDGSSIKIDIQNCYFGNNTVTSAGSFYNLFEIGSKYADMSVIENNYFAKGCCTHNVINLYDVEDGASIFVLNNHFELSKNAVRIGFKGDAKANVSIMNNNYDETDVDPAWAGILIIQPYAKETISFKNVTVLLSNNKYLNGTCQNWYLYCGSGDTQITEDLAPVVIEK